jgi:sugar fermentation stimulation protein A
MKNLKCRVARHLRKNKKKHWHIDYLTEKNKVIKVFEIKSLRNIECEIAKELDKISDNKIDSFGCTDCKCKSHLFYFKTNPLKLINFIEMVFDFRYKKINK